MCGWWLGTIRMVKGLSDMKMIQHKISILLHSSYRNFQCFHCVYKTYDERKMKSDDTTYKNKRRINVDLFVYM